MNPYNTRIRGIGRRLLLVVLLAVPAITMHAKGKNADMLNDLVPLHVLDRFDHAIEQLHQPWTDQFIDSLTQVGQQRNGTGYMALSHVLQSYKAFMDNDSTRFLSLSRIILDETREAHFYSLYYNQYTNLVEFYMNNGQPYQAQRITKELIKDASDNDNLNGLTNGYISLGTTHNKLKQYRSAIQCFQKAYDYACQMEIGKAPLAQLLYHIGYNYSMVGLYKDAIEYMQQSIRTSPTEPEAWQCLAYCYYKQGRYDDFRQAMNTLQKRHDVELIQDNSIYLFLIAMQQALDRNYDRALALCDSITKNDIAAQAMSEVYRMQQNWEMAYKYYEKSKQITDTLNINELYKMLNEASTELDIMNELHRKDAQIRNNKIAIISVSYSAIILVVLIIAFVWHIKGKSKRQVRQLMFMKKYSEELAKARAEAEDTRQQAEKAKKVAEKANQMKTMFMQNMSHDVRTPLNAIVGFSQLLGLPDGLITQEEKEKYSKYISTSAEMLMMLLNDILNVDEIERGNFTIDIQPTECNTICRNVMKCVEFRIPLGVEFNFESNVPDGYTINTDGRRIQQVLMNYLTNACKHTTQGEIRIICNVDEKQHKATFSVADTGEGVPPEMRDQIFHRFVTDDKADSHGLGLSICRTIAGKMSGNAMLDNTYTQGAKFDFVIPC